MKQKTLNIRILVALLSVMASAFTFSATAQDDDLYYDYDYHFIKDGIAYKITSPNEVAVTYSAGHNFANEIWTDNYPNLASEVTIPSNISNNGTEYTVTAINYRAFHNCNNLVYVSIPPTVKVIGTDAFIGCNQLAQVNINDLEAWCQIEIKHSLSSQPNLGMLPFKKPYDLLLNGSKVTQLVIPEGITKITIGKFAYCNITSVVIPSSVTSIDTWAFYNTALSQVNVPATVSQIDGWAFAYCEHLKQVTLPNSITKIATALFAYSGIESIELPESVTTIEGNAFANCDQLKTVTIPAAVTSLDGYYIFSESPNLTAINSHITKPYLVNIGEYTFSGLNPNCVLYVPKGLVEEYQRVEKWRRPFASIVEGNWGNEEPKPLRGDLDNNGMVDIDDINCLINIILGFE